MNKETAVKLFEEQKVRVEWDENQEKWYFSIVDVIAILSQTPNPQTYWRVLKHRLIKEGNQTVTNCNALLHFNHFADISKMVKVSLNKRFYRFANTSKTFKTIIFNYGRSAIIKKVF